MKQFNIIIGIAGFVINVNESRRTFTLTENVYENGKFWRRFKSKSFPLSKKIFESYCSLFEKLENNSEEWKEFRFYNVIKSLFPDYD